MRVVLRSLGLVVVTFFLLVCMELNRLFVPRARKTAVTQRWMTRYGRAGMWLLGGRFVGPARAPEPGSDARGIGRLFVMNHRSLLDVFVYLSLFEASALSRADLARWPVIGLAARRTGTLFVDRADKASGSAAVATMADALSRGRGVIAFPEGTTHVDDEVRPFRNGAFVAAARAGAEVVPVGIAYESPDAHFGDEPFSAHWSRLVGAPRTRVAVEIGAPMAAGEDVEASAEKARGAVQALVHAARTRFGEPQATAATG